MKNILVLLIGLSLLTGPMACRKTPGTTGALTPVQTTPTDTSTRFQNPLLTVGPDPWAVYHAGFYYVMHTTGNDLRIYKTARMSQLGTSTYTTAWSPPGSPATRDIWAPELHRVGSRWYIYYAALVAPNSQHRMYVLENEAADPLTGTWVAKGELQLPDNRWAIDGTLLQLNNKLYYAWSGWESASAADGRHQNIYVCAMTDPLTPTGPRVRVSSPDYDWEKVGSPAEPKVNEGPEFLVRNGKVFLVYSASHCSTDAYALGMLTANATADLMNPASWTKSATPVFGPSAANGAYGVGHNGFFQTPDQKEDWIIYHANPQAGQGCNDKRSIRMQPFTWKADGSPDFGKPAPLSALLKRPSGE